MFFSIPTDTFTVCRDAAGVAGNIFAFGLFVSPIPTFRRIIRNQSTEQFSGLPYIYALLNCLICTWYGTPLISYDNVLVMTVNSIGAVFQITYIILFIIYADKEIKIRMLGLLLAVIGLLAIIIGGSLQIVDRKVRWIFIGLLSCASLISMFASPLFIIVPNGIGTILGIVQLLLYFYYKRISIEDSEEPLMVSHV
ncbi:bidirectional sugar transporter SWEET2-like isoform X2 [Durio zibethinus]|uniref:Bidirectional sugar transporter SWEET2-like isoform X2 n=1 Tax=Durio zibethinus TaxID=66656 RepID=A0A6P5WQS8_DURZI|nr:bidirectional sugar transporter SWEET2-like isoform X2 [Durio zibethinus]